MDEEKTYEIDKLKILSGEPIIISDLLTLYQPNIRQIKDFGEQKFLNTLWLMCSCAWDMPSAFADMGIDFMSVSDWEFFIQTVKSALFTRTCFMRSSSLSRRVSSCFLMRPSI